MGRTEDAEEKVSCACRLPEEMPPEVQDVLESMGGIDSLPGMLPPGDALTREARVHRAMADPLRLRVLHLLAISSFCVCVVRAVTGVEDSRLSYHLGILRDAGLVVSRKQGSFLVYNLSDEGRARVRRGP